MDKTRRAERQSKVINSRMSRGLVACAECRRMKQKCDKKVFDLKQFLICFTDDPKFEGNAPASARLENLLVVKNQGLIVAQDSSSPQSQSQIVQLRERNLQLENALAVAHSHLSKDIHPLLAPSGQPRDDLEVDKIADILGTLAVSETGEVKYFGPSASTEVPLSRLTFHLRINANIGQTLYQAISVNDKAKPSRWPSSQANPGTYIRESLGSDAPQFSYQNGVFCFFHYWLEADRYFQIGLSCLAMQSIFNSPEVASVQALFLLGYYNEHPGAASTATLSPSWTIISLACKLAQGLGLHRDPAKWNLDKTTVHRRTVVVLGAGINRSFSCRPPSSRLSYIDTELPEDVGRTDTRGQPLQGFFRCKHELVRDCYFEVVETLLSAKPVKYEAILELDCKVRAKAIPAHLNRILIDAEDVPDLTAPEFMQMCILGVARSMVLLSIHRTYLTRTLEDPSDNPLKSRYAPSFLASYRAASLIVKSFNAGQKRFPVLFSRLWHPWTYVLTAAMVLGSIAIHAPSSLIGNGPLEELKVASSMLGDAAARTVSYRTKNGAKVVQKILARAEEAHCSPLGSLEDVHPSLIDFLTTAPMTQVASSATFQDMEWAPVDPPLAFPFHDSDFMPSQLDGWTYNPVPLPQTQYSSESLGRLSASGLHASNEFGDYLHPSAPTNVGAEHSNNSPWEDFMEQNLSFRVKELEGDIHVDNFFPLLLPLDPSSLSGSVCVTRGIVALLIDSFLTSSEDAEDKRLPSMAASRRAQLDGSDKKRSRKLFQPSSQHKWRISPAGVIDYVVRPYEKTKDSLVQSKQEDGKDEETSGEDAQYSDENAALSSQNSCLKHTRNVVPNLELFRRRSWQVTIDQKLLRSPFITSRISGRSSGSLKVLTTPSCLLANTMDDKIRHSERRNKVTKKRTSLGLVACAECRRMKFDDNVQASGKLFSRQESRFVLEEDSFRREVQDEISRLRIRSSYKYDRNLELEDALACAHSHISKEIHPVLAKPLVQPQDNPEADESANMSRTTEVTIFHYRQKPSALIDWTEADRYFQVGLSCLSMQSIFYSPEVASVQARFLLASYIELRGSTSASNPSPSSSVHFSEDVPSMVIRVSGLGARSAVGKVTWTLSYQVIWVERMPMVNRYKGIKLFEVFRWKYEAARDCYFDVVEILGAANPLTYETIIELDRKVRAKELPSHLNRILIEAGNGTGVGNHVPIREFMQSWVLGVARSMDPSGNPLKSPYAPSVSTSRKDDSPFYFHDFGILGLMMVLGSIAIDAPSVPVGNTPLGELQNRIFHDKEWGQDCPEDPRSGRGSPRLTSWQRMPDQFNRLFAFLPPIAETMNWLSWVDRPDFYLKVPGFPSHSSDPASPSPGPLDDVHPSLINFLTTAPVTQVASSMMFQDMEETAFGPQLAFPFHDPGIGPPQPYNWAYDPLPIPQNQYHSGNIIYPAASGLHIFDTFENYLNPAGPPVELGSEPNALTPWQDFMKQHSLT
ncbi:hypothetical protein DL96DRAFT_1557153 [Flagelloscypha sp. PMI_526]|nr:hypothetical protein DL96DRAFT_1557153 [Flagelloscypha sp. PMI_526]